MQKQWELTLYDVNGVVVDAGEGPNRVGVVADLRAIVQTMVHCARLEGQLRPEAEFDRMGVLVIIAYDATPFHKTSATRCVM